MGEEAEEVEWGLVELVGSAATMGQAVRCLGVLGRAAIVALSREALSFLPYTELINKEAEVIGAALMFVQVRQRTSVTATGMLENDRVALTAKPARMHEPKLLSSNDEIKRSELIDYVRDTDLVVVSGTGVTMQSVGYPHRPHTGAASWPGLLQHGFEYCKEHGLIGSDDTEVLELQLKKRTTRNLVDAARQIYDWLERRPGNTKYNWLKESIGQLTIHDRSLIQALADLGGLLATLNYDGLHTAVTGRVPLHWKQLTDVDEQLHRKSTNFIFHIHGWWERPESVVLDSQSYFEISTDNAMKELLRDFARFRSLLFVGCVGTFFDPNFNMLLTWANEALRTQRHRHFVLCRSCDQPALHSELQQWGILEPLVYGEQFSDLAPFLRKVGEEAGRTVAAANPPVAVPASSSSPAIQSATEVWESELK